MLPDRAAAFIVFILLNIIALGAITVHATLPGYDTSADSRLELVRRLGLTDLCLFTEARYTRHPAMADMHTAFQDHPASLEHFPSGSFIGPPPHIDTVYAKKRIKDGRAQ